MNIISCIISFVIAHGLICYCDGQCPDGSVNGTCRTSAGGFCFSALETVWDKDLSKFVHERNYGCLPPHEPGLMQVGNCLYF